MKIAFLLPLLFLLVVDEPAYGQHNNLAFKNLEADINETPKPILLYIYTNWCVYCKMQQEQMKKDTALQGLLKNKFYHISFDAESKETIIFTRQTYQYKPNGLENGVHELTLLGWDRRQAIAYPLWLLFDKNYKLIYRNSGSITINQLKKMLDRL